MLGRSQRAPLRILPTNTADQHLIPYHLTFKVSLVVRKSLSRNREPPAVRGQGVERRCNPRWRKVILRGCQLGMGQWSHVTVPQRARVLILDRTTNGSTSDYSQEQLFRCLYTHTRFEKKPVTYIQFHQGVLYSQKVKRFHGTRVNIISFAP